MRLQRIRREIATVAVAAVLASLTLAPSARAEPGRKPGPDAGFRRLPALTTAPPDALLRALRADRLTEAQYALQRARSLFRIGAVRARFGDVHRPHPRAATFILRDLMLRVARLSGSQRAQARALLARPTDGDVDPEGHGYTVPAEHTCSVHACVHWVETTADAPPLGDDDANGIPDWVDTTLTVVDEVWATIVDGHGYREPKSDQTSANAGPDGKLDLYLGDIGDDGIYGYCTSDDPNLSDLGTPDYPHYDLSAYCVVDDDFSPDQFAGTTGLDALQVTVAHELFHAVQFAYDVAEDLWLMEGTATWMEDEVYDDIDDNRGYLSASPLSDPHVPTDRGTGLFPYGSWIFWRFLAEYHGSAGTSDAAIVQRVWQLADGSPAGVDQYSLQAVATATADRGTAFRPLFAAFGAANAFPAAFYDEGGAYPTPPAARSYTLRRGRPTVGWAGITTRHLTTRYIAFRPGRRAGRDARLRVTLDLPRRTTGPEATLVVRWRSGKVRSFGVTLSSRGDGVRTVPFGRGTVKKAILVLTNTSTRFRCWQGTSFSCQGEARDDGWAYRYRAELRR